MVGQSAKELLKGCFSSVRKSVCPGFIYKLLIIINQLLTVVGIPPDSNVRIRAYTVPIHEVFLICLLTLGFGSNNIYVTVGLSLPRNRRQRNRKMITFCCRRCRQTMTLPLRVVQRHEEQCAQAMSNLAAFFYIRGRDKWEYV